MVKIAIIGAGLSGLVLAHHLKSHAAITIYEKSRGVGGRMATRYQEDFEFDHGLPYFQIHSQEFMDFLKPWLELGVVKQWPIRYFNSNSSQKENTRHYIACPRMNSLCKALAQDISIELNSKIEDIAFLRAQGFDWIISTAPYPQTQALFPQMPNLPVKMQPCFALMLGFKNHQTFAWDITAPEHSIIEKICINSHKPERKNDLSICVFSNASWAEKHIEQPEEWLKHQLLNELQKMVPFIKTPDHIGIHRWRYALAVPQSTPQIWFNEEEQLAACGDWSLGPNLEDAYQSARLLSKKILERVN